MTSSYASACASTLLAATIGLSCLAPPTLDEPQENAAEKALPEATHKQSGKVAIPVNRKRTTVHSLSLDGAGNLLVACGPKEDRRLVLADAADRKPSSRPGSIHVVNPAGKLLATWPISFQPQAIDTGPAGHVYCGGEGQLAELAPDGAVLKTAAAPHLAELRSLQPDGKRGPPPSKSALRYKRRVNAIAVTQRDVFAACPEAKGYGYGIWRLDADLRNPTKIARGLRGCCGQLDIQASQGKVFVAENARKRVVCYDREGKKLCAWGKSDRSGIDGFGSCCNPMNIGLGPDGSLYTVESDPGRIKRFGPDGTLLDFVGVGGKFPSCIHVPIAITRDTNTVYLCDTDKAELVVLKRRQQQ